MSNRRAFTSTIEVIDALGGSAAVASLTGRRTSAVSNWRLQAHFPSNTYLIMREALEALALEARPEWLWDMARARIASRAAPKPSPPSRRSSPMRAGSARRDLFGQPLRREPFDKNAEARRQASVVDYVRTVAPHIRIFAIPNGGLRTEAEAARLKWTGVLAGVLDLGLILPEGRSAYWETKTPRGRLSDDQREFIGALEALGNRWALVRDIDDARRELADLGVITREAAP